MSEKWYIGQNGVQSGPFPREKLEEMARRGELRAQDMVWHEGMAGWVEAGTVDGLGLAPEPFDLAPGADEPFNRPRQVIPGTQPVQLGYYAPASATHPNYAGFWWRFLAVLLDGILLLIVLLPIEIAFDFIFGLGEFGSTRTATPEVAIVAMLINIVIQYGAYLLYYGFMESSKHQATLGKMACGLYVTDAAGDRLTLGRAMCRYLASLLSGLILAIGYIMGAFTEKKQCLHDLICGTFVIKK